METSATEKTPAKALNINAQIIEVAIDKLAVPLSHPRKTPVSSYDLAASIKANGLIEPLTVCETEVDGQFIVIDGARRLTIVAKEGWTTVPCIVHKSMSLAEIGHTSYLKNMERESLNPIDVANHIKSMRDSYGYSLRELEALGYGTPSGISQKLQLLTLPRVLQQGIALGNFTAAHGDALLPLKDPGIQKRMADQAYDEGWTASKLAGYVERFIKKGGKEPAEREVFEISGLPGIRIADSREMREIETESVHLIVTEGDRLVTMPYGRDSSPSLHWENVKAVLEESGRVLVNGGVLAMVIRDTLAYPYQKGKRPSIHLAAHKYQSALKKPGVELMDVLVWAANGPDEKQHLPAAEYGEIYHTEYPVPIRNYSICIFRKKDDREHPSNEAAIQKRISSEDWREWTSGIWTIDYSAEGQDLLPEELVRRLVLMFSYEGDTVLDPFLGTGTTVKVAREHNRVGIGYERDAKLQDAIKQKLGVVEPPAPSESMADFVKRSATAEDDALLTAAQVKAYGKIFDEEAQSSEAA